MASNSSHSLNNRFNWLSEASARITAWSERWYPDSFVFAAIAVLGVAGAAWFHGTPAPQIAQAFGEGYWSLIPFTLQMAMVSISGYVVAVSPPVSRIIEALARIPKNGKTAVAFVAASTILASLLNWALSLAFGGLLVRALARRKDLRMDYRAAGAAAYLGLGATWALGLSSSAAQLQANAQSIPTSLLPITGVIPFSETILLPQSLILLAVISALSVLLAYASAPSDLTADTAEALRISLDLNRPEERSHPGAPSRPADWLERSPLLSLGLSALGFFSLFQLFQTQSPALAISNLNHYNLFFISLGLLLNGTPRRFLKAVTDAIPSISGVLVQFPLYGALATILTRGSSGPESSLAHALAQFFVSVSTHATFPAVMSIYSAVLGFFVPSGGGKWVVEAPYVMKAANDLQVHLGWTVTIYNAAEALPNLINPFWMLPLLGVLKLKARDLIGYTFVQFLFHVPIVISLLWILAATLTYHPPSL